MLCRPKSGKGQKPLEIAVVVSAQNRDHAKLRADNYIGVIARHKNGKIKCDRVDKPSKQTLNAYEASENESSGDEDDSGKCDENDDDTVEIVDPSGSAVPVETSASVVQKPLVTYEPKDLLALYKKGVNKPLGGGVSQHDGKSVIQILNANYRKLKESKEQDTNFKSTWLVMHPDHKDKSASLTDNYYDDKNNKVVVVVLSKMFFLPSEPGRITVEEPILVCNVPYFKGKLDTPKAALAYNNVFKQIGAFVDTYNKTKDDHDKIKIIAVSYPTGLSVTDDQSTPPMQTRTAGNTKGLGKGKGARVVVDRISKIWLDELNSFNTESKYDIRLMYEEKPDSGIWHAPSVVKSKFTDKIMNAFPSCIDNIEGKSASSTVIGKADLKNTLFVCDLLQKNRVGNNNDTQTTGGVFGSFVPMHYTAALIKADDFSNADDINGLIDVIHTNQKTAAAAKASGQNASAAPATTPAPSKTIAPASVLPTTTTVAPNPNKSVNHAPNGNGSNTAKATIAPNGATNGTAPSTANKINFGDLETEDARRKLVDTIFRIYHNGYEPPTWVGENYVKEFAKYAPEAQLFYDDKQDLEIVKSVASEREPVNMTVTQDKKEERLRGFNEENMKSSFGYNTSYYERYYKEIQSGSKKIAPNIGVLTLSLVDVTETTGTNTKAEAYIYHAIGAALDHEDQPDYQSFVQKNDDGVNVNQKGLQQFYVSVFAKIFAAANKCKANGIVMSLVGAEAFASKYPNGGKNEMQKKVWIPAFKYVRAIKKNSDVKLALMHRDGEAGPAIEYMTCKDVNAKKVGLFPEFLKGEKYNTYQNWMIVNAWDCHTIPGNGNEGDNTLDGHIGRRSSIHYFGWGISNPHLLKDGNMIGVEIPMYVEPTGSNSQKKSKN